MTHTRFDWNRAARTGLPEVIYAEGKSVRQIADTLAKARERGIPLLLTRLSAAKARHLKAGDLAHDPVSRTAVLGELPPVTSGPVGIVVAGTSDLPVAAEVARASRFFGVEVRMFCDVGVASLWRLQAVLPELQPCRVLVAVAGMEGALFPVLAGLVPQLVIAVPTPVGYGVAAEGRAALSTALSSCSPGLVVVNVGNGLGAAAAVARFLRTRAGTAETFGGL